jgi:hypothetical protein
MLGHAIGIHSFLFLLSHDAAVDLGREVDQGISDLYRIGCHRLQSLRRLRKPSKLTASVGADIGQRQRWMNPSSASHHCLEQRLARLIVIDHR